MANNQTAAAQDQMLSKYWTDQAPSYGPKYEGTRNEAHAFRIRLQRVCELLEDPGSRTLDIGCGPGIMVEQLLESGSEAFGVDIAEGMISECEKSFSGNPNAHFSVGQIENLEFDDEFFDSVVCMGVVEYIADDDIAVKEMARVTKPGGQVIITVPNRLSPYRIWDRNVYRILSNSAKKVIGRPKKGIWHKEYLEGRYRELLMSHGLVPTDVVYYSFKVMPSPLDVIFRKLTADIAAKLEILHRSKLGWLGTGFIVKGIKE